MKSKAFIIEFQEGVDFVQTYRSLLRNNRFVLRTRISLALGERVKVRFNIPDGNGVTLRCKVATQIDDQAWGINLPKNDDVRWLQEKAVDAEKLLGPMAKRIPEESQDDDLWETHPSALSKKNKPPKDSAGASKSTASPKKPVGPVGPVTVNIAPGGCAEALIQHFGAPEAEFVDPERDGFPSLKDTGMDLLKELDKQATGNDPMVERQSPGQQNLGITQEVRRKRGGGLGDIPGVILSDPTGEAGIDFPYGVKRPSMETIKRLREMSLTQKKQLAISGNATERMLLIQDKERAIQLWVLKNPQVTEIEIRWLSSMTTLTPEAVGFLVVNPKWAAIPEISINLLSNPITPTDAIQRLLMILPTQVLLVLYQKPGVRPMVADMAKKLLMERGEI